MPDQYSSPRPYFRSDDIEQKLCNRGWPLVGGLSTQLCFYCEDQFI